MSRGGAPKLRNRRVPPPPIRRRGQGVITGLAARRPAALLKRVGTFNRAATKQVMEECSPNQACVSGLSHIDADCWKHSLHSFTLRSCAVGII